MQKQKYRPTTDNPTVQQGSTQKPVTQKQEQATISLILNNMILKNRHAFEERELSY